MIKKSLRSLFVLALLSGSTLTLAAVPTHQEIIKNLTNIDDSYASPKQAIEIETTKAVILRSGELAYLSSVTFENSGRNFWAGYILTRPKLKQSKIIEFGGQSNTFRVHPYSHENKLLNLIEIESAGSGQGQVSNSIDLVYFDGWNAQKITTIESESHPSRYIDSLGEEDCQAGSGQGQVSNSIDLVYFDDWNAQKITAVESESHPSRYIESLGEEDCQTGGNVEGTLKIFAKQHEVLKIIKTSNACENAKIMTKLEKVKIVIQ